MPHAPNIDSARLLERFLRYVRIDTTAQPDNSDYPSSHGQLELGQLLGQELKAMGAVDVEQDRHGLVWATVPATVPGSIPTVLFNAHLDTSPEAPGRDVRPQVIEAYQGGDIRLQHDERIITVADCPALAKMQGHCLITTDGTTLLGGDDKAGVAAIMELTQTLLEHPHLPHGEVRVLFTCDEEIGRGAQHLDLGRAAARLGYTLDGSGQGEIEAENFSADQLTVRALGNNIHPSIGKGRMVNAVRGLARLIANLPVDRLSPESTDGKDGFLHPYAISGGVYAAETKILLRDFETSKLDDYESLVRSLAEQVAAELPGLKFEITRSAQYRNMAEVIRQFPQVVDFAVKAFEQLGETCHIGSIRGGTDGAMFSAMGLPTPNLAVGQHNIHSVLEFTSLNEMVLAVRHAVKLLEIWSAQAKS